MIVVSPKMSSLRTLIDDIRWSLLAVLRRGRASLSVVALLALAIAATTVVFAVVHRVVLQPLPVAAPGQLAWLTVVRGDAWRVKEPDFSLATHLATRQPQLRHRIAGEAVQEVEVIGLGETRRLQAALVTPDYFRVLGLRPAAGRLLDPGDHADDAGERGAVLSHRWWYDRLGADAGIIGNSITVFGRAYTVVGVLPPGYRGLDVDDGADLFLPRRACRDCELAEGSPWTDRPATLFLRVPPTLDHRALTAAAQDALVTDRQQFVDRTPDLTAEDQLRELESRVRLDPLRTGISPVRERFQRTLWVLLGAATLLLLLLSGNVAGLGLARAVERERDWQLRAWMGATPGRLRRQAMLETLLLALAGGGAGIVLAAATVPRLGGLLPPALKGWQPDGGLAPPEWLFAVGLTVLCGVLTATPSMLRAGAVATRRAVDRSSAEMRAARTGRALVGVQTGLCTLLLGGAALFLRTFAELHAVPPGFDSSRVATFDLSGPPGQEREPVALVAPVLEHVRAVPGVEEAAFADFGLMRGIGLKVTVQPTGQMLRRTDFLNTSAIPVSPEYVRLLRLPLLAGRGLDWRDVRLSDGLKRDPASSGPPTPVLANPKFCARFFPLGRCVDQTFGSGMGVVAGADFQVVGIVQSTKVRSLREAHPPVFFLPLEERVGSGVLYVRTSQSVARISSAVQDALQGTGLEVTAVTSLDAEIEATLWQERTLAVMSTAFAALGLLLAATGLYGLLAFLAAARRREIGVRLALGAGPDDITRLMLREAGRPLLAGLVVGAAAYVAASRLLVALLYGVQPANVGVLAAVIGVLVAVAAAATAVPIWRAIRVDPAVCLRDGG